MQFSYSGNYCGPGWTGGKYVAPGEQGDYSVTPTDALDALCRTHDIEYGKADQARIAGQDGEYWRFINESDQALIHGATQLANELRNKMLSSPWGSSEFDQSMKHLSRTGTILDTFLLKKKFVDEPGRVKAPPTAEEQRAIDKFLYDNGLTGPTVGPRDYKDLPSIRDSLQKALEQLKLAEASAGGSPLILDLDNDGVETLGINAGIHFDVNANGFAESTGWVAPDDGLLVLDRDGNGIIDNGRELFGNHTQESKDVIAQNGFLALLTLDTSHDYQIDQNDSQFNQLRVWRDLNSDGKSTSNELFRLDALGINSINLHYTQSTTVDVNNNEHRQIGSFAQADGGISTIIDVWFQSDTFLSRTRPYINIDPAIVSLPDLPGAGNLVGLLEAITLDSSGVLRLLVEQYVSSPNIATAKERFAEILLRWTGADDIPAGTTIGGIDARKLYVIEQITGENYYDISGSAAPLGRAIPILHQAYAAIFDSLFGSFAAQTQYKEAYEKVYYEWNSQTAAVQLNVSVLVDYLQQKFSNDEKNAIQFINELGKNMKANSAFTQQILDLMHAVSGPDSHGFLFAVASMGYDHSLIGDVNARRYTQVRTVARLAEKAVYIQ